LSKGLIIVSKESGLEEYAEKPKYTHMFCYQNKGKNPKVNIANKSFKKLCEVLVFVKGTMKSDHLVAN